MVANIVNCFEWLLVRKLLQKMQSIYHLITTRSKNHSWRQAAHAAGRPLGAVQRPATTSCLSPSVFTGCTRQVIDSDVPSLSILHIHPASVKPKNPSGPERRGGPMPRVPAVAPARVRPAGGKCEAADAQEAPGESLCCGSSSCSQSRPPGFDLWAKQVQKQNRTPGASRTKQR